MKIFPFAVLCCLAASFASGQAPTITSIRVDSTGCEFSAGAEGQPCSIGPGMVLQVFGQSFGPAGGGVGLCDCPDSTTVRWTPTHITISVDEVTPQSVIRVETKGGGYSNTIPYMALAPVITGLDVGGCHYTPNISHHQCAITPGPTVTILGNQLTGSTSVTFDGTAAIFTVNSFGTAITTTVPEGATTGTVEVTTPTSILSSNVPFRVM